MSVTFDGPNKLMILDPGVVSISAQTLYSLWVNWLASDTNNAKWLPAWSQEGGTPTVSGGFSGLILFVTNGWRIRPHEADHRLQITGNIIGEGNAVIIAPTVGAFTVSVEYVFSNLAQGISTGSGLNTRQNQLLENVSASQSGKTERDGPDFVIRDPETDAEVSRNPVGGDGTRSAPTYLRGLIP